ncbi:putative Zinc finger C x8 C x5 C x3 H type (and similar) [Trypanosoma vivax]|uniref:C3H1-type domain-containing protein n=1 Tax=Trypanosoma vivax (strain Y486) TaxID=1055687 RepID=G0TV56_TRYVY|nr:hypothetical protein TRVL_10283 [Trypanosoma vivax]KAH8613601.1 putative Zinc finger C x8 C x5 C x3 H type (and similar) [Trypanosoma vivax]CCC47822.1 conserved hypothetical protein [Trypanosoma vivax Y486]
MAFDSSSVTSLQSLSAPDVLPPSLSVDKPHFFADYNADFNKHGKTLLAERYKTKLCKNFMELSFCPYGFICMFAHGEEELRTPKMNVEDGLSTEESIRVFQRMWYKVAFQQQHSAVQNSVGFLWPFTCTSLMPPPPYHHHVPYFAQIPVKSTTSFPPPAARYRHDPYCAEVIPPESRFYSRLPDAALDSQEARNKHCYCSRAQSDNGKEGALCTASPASECFSQFQLTTLQLQNSENEPQLLPHIRSDDGDSSLCSSVGSHSGLSRSMSVTNSLAKRSESLSTYHEVEVIQ